MRKSTFGIVVAGVGLLAGPAHADFLVHLKSGNVLRADRTWTEGDTLKVQFRTGVASFPQDAVASIEQVADRLPEMPAERPAAAAHAAAPAAKPAAPKAATAKTESAKSGGKPAEPVIGDAGVPDVAGEDAQTKMERLDGLSMQTHRQLSIARRQGQSEGNLKALENRIDEINRQRAETMKKLR